MSETFMQRVLEGRELWLDADDWVERWHDGEGKVPLHDYLGMTWSEYQLWTEKPEALRLIIAARQANRPVEELLADTHEFAVAARGVSETDASVVAQWLKDTGRLKS
jgi:hypothetical protein